MIFGSDQVLLYNVEPWSKLGFGVPNFGDDVFTVNQILWSLTDEIGRQQLHLMTHVDVTRLQAPSRNTVERIGRTLNRVQAILQGRAKPSGQLRTEPGHGSPAKRPWNIHPVPYFDGPIVRNHWLRLYNEYCMLALANAYQHTDNSLALTLTPEGAGDIWIYFNDLRRLLAIELLGLTPAVVDDPAFQFSEEHYAAYDPAKLTVRVEAIDTPVLPDNRFTEDDVRPFVQGIPANLIIANLARYPVSANDQFEGVKGTGGPRPGTEAPGTSGGANIDPVV